MFFHKQETQFKAVPDHSDALLGRKMQELIGGQYGEISVMMQYLFQGWNVKMPGKYKDMLLDIGTEEIGHVEMLATMVARLLEKAPLGPLENQVVADPTVAAVVGGMDVQHAIVAGAGARPVDSNGNPWQGAFVTASGNLMADFHANANAEMQGRLQAARIYEMTDDSGVRDMLRFLIARDTMHQNQWLAAIEELKADGLEAFPVPSGLGDGDEVSEFTGAYLKHSDGAASAEGRWARGPRPDGHGDFVYLDAPPPGVPLPPPPAADPRLHATATPDQIVLPKDGGGAGIADKVKGALGAQ